MTSATPRVRALLERHGLDEDNASDPGHDAPVLEGWAVMSVEPPSCHAQWEGFDLHAGAVQLRRPRADGTTHLVFEPRAFLARLAVLVPRPRVNLVLYHGALGPRAAWRQRISRPPRTPPPANVAAGAEPI